jgi:hypothetical protein
MLMEKGTFGYLAEPIHFSRQASSPELAMGKSSELAMAAIHRRVTFLT